MLKIWLCYAALINFSILYSQKETAQWRFVEKSGLNFLTNPPTVTSSTILGGGAGGSATQSDSAGNLQFYVGYNGSGSTSVFNKNDGLMANGASLDCSQNFQAAWIVPKQGKQYYVITQNVLKFLMPHPFPPM